MSVSLYGWQEASAAQFQESLTRFNVAANGSEMGTGKTVVTTVVAKRLQRRLFVLTRKSVVLDWHRWAGEVGVECVAMTAAKVRLGKSGLGHWVVKGRAFQWDLPPDALLVFDEAHDFGGIDTQQSRLLMAAKNQGLMHAVLSGTLFDNPMKCKAIGYSLGLHNLLDFWVWARKNGVRPGMFGMEFRPKNETPVQVMERLRLSLGMKFTRIRKADVPGFPVKNVIPFSVDTDTMPPDAELEGGRYGTDARRTVELMKLPGIIDRTQLLLDEGHSVVLFVNYHESFHALVAEFGDVCQVIGGQTDNQRAENIDRFQTNKVHVAVVMTQAGGTGTSFHDLYGRPRSSIICPGSSAPGFLQAIDRIHRAGALSPANIYVALAERIPVEKRIRKQIEKKLANLAALNDSDLDIQSGNQQHSIQHATTTSHSGGALPENSGASSHEQPLQSDQCSGDKIGQPHGPSGSPFCGFGDDDGTSVAGGDSHPDGETPPFGTADIFDPSTHAYTNNPGNSSGHSPGSSGPGKAHEPDHPASHHSVSPGAGHGTHPSEPSNEAAPMVKINLAKVPKPAELVVTHNTDPATAMPLPGPAELPQSDAVKATLAQRIEAKVEANHGERKHARSSPSKLKNLEICPSYEGDNSGPVHPVTLRGTAMHEASETGSMAGLDEEEVRLVTMCNDFMSEEIAIAEKVIDEQHLKTHDPDVQGFVDKIIVFKPNAQGRRKLAIRDYKYGWNAVDGPRENPQAIAYTLAAFLQWPDADEIDFAFLIPRLDLVLTHTFTRADMDWMKLRISTIAERVRKLAGKEFNVVDSNCLYCGYKAHCKPMHAKSLTIARANDNPDLQLPLPAILDPSQMTDPQQVAYGLNVAAHVEDWVKRMRARALDIRLETGVEIPGYTLVEQQAKREIANPPGAWEVIKTEFGVTQEEFLSACKVSITQLETVVKDHAPHGKKAEAATKFTDRLADEGFLTRGASFPVLRRDKKKAPAKTVTE